MRAEQLTRIFLAKLAGTPVFDPNGDRVGKIRDAVASIPAAGRRPRIFGFLVEVPQRRRIFIPITRVTSIDDAGVYITGALNIRRYQLRESEWLLLESLLDHEVTLDGDDHCHIDDIAIELDGNREWFATQVHVTKRTSRWRRGASETVEWSRVDHGFKRPSNRSNDVSEMPAQEVAAELGLLAPAQRAEVAKSLDDDKLADVLEEMDDSERVAIVSTLDGERVADVLEEMAPDDAADVLREIGSEKAESLLNLMEEEEAEDVRRLMRYEDYSAGGMMTTDPVILSSDSTVAEALAAVRREDLAPALASQVFVCRAPFETPTGRMIGIIHLQRLLREAPALTLGELVDSDANALAPETPLNDVVKHLANYNLIAAPVVDESERLLGAVTVDDVLDHLLPTNWRTTERRS